MFSQLVMDKIRELRASIPPVNLADPAILRANLLFVAHMIRATEDLLLEAAQASRGVGHFKSLLQNYFISHYEEEQQHYEWLMKDLGLVTLKEPDWLAAEVVGAQLYLIKYFSPVALLGYMAVLEGDPTPLAQVEVLEELHGPHLLRCIRFHAEHDLEHRKELFDVIDKVPSELQSIVMESAVHTVLLMHSAQKTWS
jgi:hypothetical protein